MTLARVRAWVQKLPPADLDLPILIVDGMAYTPRAALMEVERGTPTGTKIQALIESGRFGTTLNDTVALAKLRLAQILSKYPPDKPIVATIGTLELPGRTYTPRELLEEIQKQTPVGKRWVQSEITRMQMLLSLAR